MKRIGLILIASWLLAGGVAHAQFPTSIQPNGLDGYSVYTPGQMPTQVTPNGLGGYSVFSPPVAAPPVYSPTPLRPPAYMPPPPYVPQGYAPFNGQSAGAQMYGP
jgi:hypothetical protein